MTPNTKVRGFLLGFAAAVLVACGDSPDSLVGSAKEFLAKGDTKSAVIQLKNALQKSPDIAEARFLLGKAQLDTGDVLAAEKELRKALELKYPADDVVPLLARSMAGSGQYKAVIDEFGGTSVASARGTAELQAALGQAYLATGNTEKGRAAIGAALAAQPDYAPAILGDARLKASTGDLDGALASIDAAIARNPKFVEGWLFKGDLENARKQPDAAVAAYRKALEVEPKSLAAQSALVKTLFDQGKTHEAATQLATMKQIAPRHPQTLLLDATLAYSRKDYAAAAAALQPLLSMAPDHVQGLVLSGAVHYQQGSYATAEEELSRELKIVPGHLFARRMLIATYLKTGKNDLAMQALKPVLPVVDKDPALAAIAGEVYLRSGQPAEAAKHFTKTVAFDPQSSGARVALAASHMAAGQTDTAFRELESAAAETPGTEADVALISNQLSRREYDKALASIDKLEKKQPNSAVASNLRGIALLGKRDVTGARKNFERATALDPTYFAAAANLARLDLAEKKPDDAKKRFEAVLAKDPKNASALLAIAELRARAGGTPDEVAALIQKAVIAQPTQALPRVALIAHWLQAGNATNAVAAGQEAAAALPDRPEVLQALGRALLAAGDANQALETFNKLARLQPNSPAPLLLVAGAQVSAKDKEGALKTLRKALSMKPDLLEAQRGVVRLEVDAGRMDPAVATARDVQKQRPKEAIGYIMEGDIYAIQKSWPAAIAAYRKGLDQTGSVDVAVKLHAVLVAAGNKADADRVEARWLREHPKDAGFRMYLAQAALAHQDYTEAAKQYRTLVEAQPGNGMYWNNLAWVAGRTKDPKAIEYAEKANRLSPDQPAILDTLGVLLVESGDKARGVEMLRKASMLAPTLPSIRLNLAKAYIATNQTDAAKKELEELAKLGDRFKAQGEVDQLMKEIAK